MLIVEDDVDIQEIYQRMITDTFDQIEVERCENGATGLDAVRRRKPDLILLDLLMPVMNGEAFLQNLRHKLNLVDIPVVVCSVNQTLANKLLRMKEVEAVLPKVFALEELVRIFGKLLGVEPRQGAPGL